jgi:hypothetical protein
VGQHEELPFLPHSALPPFFFSFLNAFQIRINIMTELRLLGLALAVLPPLASAIEDIGAKPGANAVNTAAHREWSDEFLSDIHYEVCLLNRTLERLIKELSLSDALKTKVLSEYNHDEWLDNDSKLGQAVQEHLGEFFHNFFRSLSIVLKGFATFVNEDTLPVPATESSGVSFISTSVVSLSDVHV